MKILQGIFTLLIITGISTNANAQKTGMADTSVRYIKDAAGYLMVLRQGDNIYQELEKFALKENVPAASFTGMGFVNMQFGFFDFSKKEYKPKDFKNVEMASMHGTIAWQKGKVSIHGHGVVAGEDFKAYAGHILNATVSTGSAEIIITVHSKKLERVMEEVLGANVLHLD